MLHCRLLFWWKELLMMNHLFLATFMKKLKVQFVEVSPGLCDFDKSILAMLPQLFTFPVILQKITLYISSEFAKQVYRDIFT